MGKNINIRKTISIECQQSKRAKEIAEMKAFSKKMKAKEEEMKIKKLPRVCQGTPAGRAERKPPPRAPALHRDVDRPRKVKKLVTMGFTVDKAISAIKLTNGNVEEAAAILLLDKDFEIPPAHFQDLVMMGFTVDKAISAIKLTNGNVEEAANILFLNKDFEIPPAHFLEPEHELPEHVELVAPECKYQIRNIIDHRGKAGPSREYLVHWEPCEQNGYQNDDETWERQDRLNEDGIDLKEMYWKSYPLCNYKVSDLQCSRRNKDTGCIQMNVHIPGNVRPVIYELSDFVGMSNRHFINDQVVEMVKEWKSIARDYPDRRRHCLFCDRKARWGSRLCRNHD